MPLEQLNWDGLSRTRPDPTIYAAPDGDDWNMLMAWVQAVQQVQQGAPILELIAGQNLLAGQPFYMASGLIWPSQADSEGHANVCGFTTQDAGPNSPILVVTRGQVTRDDWTPIIGAEFLEPGAAYFLSPNIAGMLTTVAPTTMGQFVVPLGKAVSPTTFDVNVEQPIGL
jgi:hypothetical protein